MKYFFHNQIFLNYHLLSSKVMFSVCNALTFESPDLESSLLTCRYIFSIARSSISTLCLKKTHPRYF